jgi:DNA-binding transcriptional regulator YiaG
MGKVYKITNLVTGKAYIGATDTEGFVERYSGGKWWRITRCHELQDDAYKYGASSFTVEILQDDVPSELLAETEINYIRQHHTLEPTGYNQSLTRFKFAKKENSDEKRIRIEKLRQERQRHEFYDRVDRGGVPIWEACKEIRTFLGLSQVEFAELCEVSPRLLTDFEQGNGNPTFETMKKLLKGSGLEISVTRKKRQY